MFNMSILIICVLLYLPSIISAQDCTNDLKEYKLPSDCDSTNEGFNCDYYAKWSHDSNTDDVSFTLKSTQSSSEEWIGIGFSDNRWMALSDIITGWIDNSGNVQVQDRWSESYSRPTVDDVNNVNEVSGIFTNGVLTIQFARARQTGDAGNDIQFSDDVCNYLMFGKGPVWSNDIGYHPMTPIVTDKRVCIRSCVQETTTTTTTTQTTTTKSTTAATTIPTTTKTTIPTTSITTSPAPTTTTTQATTAHTTTTVPTPPPTTPTTTTTKTTATTQTITQTTLPTSTNPLTTTTIASSTSAPTTPAVTTTISTTTAGSQSINSSSFSLLVTLISCFLLALLQI